VGFENPIHILFVAAVALIVLGPKRLPELTRAAGRSIREFRESLQGQDTKEEDPADRVRSPDAPDRRPL
jgi:sec-independent protein translocase protein TatA